MRKYKNKPGKSIQNKLYIILKILETMWYAFNNTTRKGKGKVLPRTGHEGPEGE